MDTQRSKFHRNWLCVCVWCVRKVDACVAGAGAELRVREPGGVAARRGRAARALVQRGAARRGRARPALGPRAPRLLAALQQALQGVLPHYARCLCCIYRDRFWIQSATIPIRPAGTNLARQHLCQKKENLK